MVGTENTGSKTLPKDRFSRACSNTLTNYACKTSLIQVYLPAYEKHIKREEWFSVFVKLGVFSELDRDQYSSSVLGFLLMSHIVRNYVHINPNISSEVNQFLSKYSGRYLVGFHLRMSDSSSDFREKYKMEQNK